MGDSTTAVLGLLLLAATPALAGQDGRLFDPGATRTHRAVGAPAALDRVNDLVGSWDLRTSAPDGTARTGGAEITWMNRGHGLMVRTFVAATDTAPEVRGIALLAVDRAGDTWTWGEADTRTLSARLLSGVASGDGIVLHTASRPGGSSTLRLVRRTLAPAAGGFTLVDEASEDVGATWTTSATTTLTRRATPVGALALAAGVGSPAADRLPAAAAFDFLIGDHTATHWLLFGGREARFQSRTTAVHALGGRAILEFDSYDVDPSLPDAATTALRIYNPSQERWESLYVTNRFNQMLWFGGTQRGDRIVLTRFDVDATQPPGRFVFHGIRGPGRYSWFADTSKDGGRTFDKTWTIDVGPGAP